MHRRCPLDMHQPYRMPSAPTPMRCPSLHSLARCTSPEQGCDTRLQAVAVGSMVSGVGDDKTLVKKVFRRHIRKRHTSVQSALCTITRPPRSSGMSRVD